MRIAPVLACLRNVPIRKVAGFLIAACLVMIASTSASAQTTYTWNQSVSTDYQIAANWTPARALPATSDILVFSGSTTPGPTVTNIPTQTIGEIHFINGVLATISTAAANTLTVGGGTAVDFEIDATSFLIVSGASALTIALSSTATGSVSGQMSVAGAAHKLIGQAASAITFQGGSVFTTSTGFTSNAFGSTTSVPVATPSSVQFLNASQYVQSASGAASPFGTSGAAAIAVFQTGSTYVHRVSSAPQATGRTYADISVDNSVTWSTSGGSNFQFDNLSVTAGSSFTHAGSSTAVVTIRGNITSAGSGNISITSGSGGIQINSGGSQTFGGGGGTGTITLNAGAAGTAITVTSGTTLTLARNLNAATGTLTINGTVDQGASFNLTTGAVNIASGATWKDVGTGDITLGGNVNNSGKVNINGTTAACGEADAVLIRSSVGGTQRTWSGTGVFDFTDVDVQDQKAMIGGSGTIAAIALSSTDSGNNTNWSIFSTCALNAARLLDFTATRFESGAVAIQWQTGYEVDNLGYNLYREAGGKRARVNPQMIAGSALLAGPGVTLAAGRNYNWADELRAEGEIRYWLEEIDLNGTSTWHGPAPLDLAKPGDEPPPDKGRAVLLSDVGTDPAHARTEPLSRAAKPAGSPGSAGVSPAGFKVTGLGQAGGTPALPAIKLSVNREAWYRVSGADLMAAGLDPNVDPRMLHMAVNGKEQAFVVRGEENGRLDPTDAVEFFGIGVDSQQTDTRVYWLFADSEPGRRIEQVKGKGGKAPASLAYTVERRDRTVYFSSLRNGAKENFFGAVLTKKPLDQSLTIQNLDSTGDASLEIAIQGVSMVAHRVSVEVNGSAVGEVRFENQAEGVATLRLNRGVLREGPNIVKLAEDADGAVSLVDYLRITYPHTYAADNNALRFTLGKKQQATITGFTSGSIRVLDVTDPDAVTEVTSQVLGRDNIFSVTVSAPRNAGGNRMLWAFAEDAAARPLQIAANKPSSLRDSTQGADLVIVTHADFARSLGPLQAARERQGVSVAVVDVEDVFDEFSFGEKSPQAIKDFLSFAKANWKRTPRFAMLVGDASLDPKNYMGRGMFDFVPTRLIDTSTMETASDNWLADFDGDGIEEIAIGRLPVRTTDQITKLVEKIVGFDDSHGSGVLLISDASDGLDFHTNRAELRQLVSRDVRVEEIDRGIMGTAGAKAQLLQSLGRGPLLVDYIGHGSIDLWRGNLLTAAESNGLANTGSLSIFFTLTCLNGYFVDPVLESLAESLVKAERGGAVAAWASSGLCDVGPQGDLSKEMFRLIFGGASGPLTLGEAAARAKASVSDGDVRRTYILFGDPSTRVR